MQLLLLLALLLYGGKGNAGKMLEQVAPVLETFGGDELKNALKSAEEISQVITAISGAAPADAAGAAQNTQNERGAEENLHTDYAFGAEDAQNNAASAFGAEDINAAGTDLNSSSKVMASANEFPLAPIVKIADKDIIYRLARFMSAV